MDPETHKLIDSIAANVSNRRAFPGYAPEDIIQEAWIICLEAIPKYDPSRGPLERYLRVCVTNRLRTLKRDKETAPELFLPQFMSPDGDSDYDDALTPKADASCDPYLQLEDKDLVAFIVERLPDDMRNDFLRVLNGYVLGSERCKLLRIEVEDLICRYRGVS